MKPTIIVAGALLLAPVSSAIGSTIGFGTPIAFDFDSLDVPRGDFVISNYMTSLYGSEVTTAGARTVNDEAAGDVFIATSIQLLDRGDFEVLFAEVPITGAQFEGHVIDATLGDDFSLKAFMGPTLVFSLVRSEGVEVFDSGWLDFGAAVDRLLISDSGRRDVGIDSLTVMAVPEPVSGLIWLAVAAVLLREPRWVRQLLI